jgi:hypothetical protein
LLAFKVVEIVHGNKEAKLCNSISDFMFSDDENRIEVIKNLSDYEIKTFMQAM